MTELLIATLCSASIALLFKYSEANDANRYVVTAANYLTALALSAILMAAEGRLPDDLGFRNAGFSIGFGVCVGIAYYIGFILYQVSIRRHGAAMTGAFAKMGVMVPVLLSLIVWREIPEPVQVVGIVLALSAVLLAALPGLRKGVREPKGLLIVVLAVIGICEFSNKVYGELGTREHKALFFLVVFLAASLASCLQARRHGGAAGRREWVLGFLIGFPNIFSAWFLIAALETVPAVVVFPVFSAGSIVLIAIGSLTFFGETLTRRDTLALVLVVPALVLINL